MVFAIPAGIYCIRVRFSIEIDVNGISAENRKL